MKKASNISSFAFGMVVCLVLVMLDVLAFASKLTKSAELEYSDIEIYLDGELVTPTDINGKSTEPFIIDGTTYLPVRAVASALGLYACWDSESSCVQLLSPEKNLFTPNEWSAPIIGPVTDIVSDDPGSGRRAIYTTDGSVYQWGSVWSWQGDSKLVKVMNGARLARRFGDVSYVIKDDGSVLGWGNAYPGENELPLLKDGGPREIITDAVFVKSGGGPTLLLNPTPALPVGPYPRSAVYKKRC